MSHGVVSQTPDSVILVLVLICVFLLIHQIGLVFTLLLYDVLPQTNMYVNIGK